MSVPASPNPPRRSRLSLLLFALPLGLAACAEAPSSRPSGDTRAAQVRHVVDRDVSWGTITDEFEQSLQGVDIEPRAIPGGGLRLVVPASQSFERASTTVRPAFRSTLQKIAALLLRHPELKLTVVGHTDSLGREMYNQQLSLDRADAVSQVLQQAGLPFTRIATLGRGETQPIADNTTEAGRAANRRVEFLIHALDSGSDN